MAHANVDRLYRVLRGRRRLAGAYLALAALLIVGVALFIDLSPHVEQDFFFASDDPALRMNEQISRIFPGGSNVTISAVGDLSSPEYQEAVARLSQDLERLADVDSVQSLAIGPKNRKHAHASPLWSRLVLGEDSRSSLVLVWLEESATVETIDRIETVARQHDGAALEVHISGVPYVVELIRRGLRKDMRVFSVAAILVFGMIVSLLFRSLPILLGMMSACLSASCLTLIATHLLGLRIGVLTANLVTIVFIMTLHHIIYLTYGWKQAAERGITGPEAAEAGVRSMLVPSFWVMLTTLLGFTSLLFGRAEPLRELGISGAVGAVVGFCVAYLVHPSFLARAGAPAKKPGRELPFGHDGALRGPFARRHGWAVALLVVASAVLATGALKLNRDPSLFAYFADGGTVREGLENIDRQGGSSPLRLVVSDSSGAPLDRKPAYRRLWALQRELEAHPRVGTVISLPLIMAEAKQSRFGRFLTHRSLLNRMEQPRHDSVADSFVTRDRQRALFVLRMKEAPERHDRLETVEELGRITESHGFDVELLGGLYYLQGQISKLVVSSLVTGVGQLLVCFLVVALLVSRSIRWSLAMLFTLALVPATVLGVIGHLGVPLDIISAPAVNLALGMAIDDMIHMTELARSLRRKGAGPWEAWARARMLSWRALLGTASIVSAGFALLVLSDFPPTRRFGLSVMGGALVDVLACLIVLPYVASVLDSGKRRDARG